MNDSWIKIYRKLSEHEIMRDPTALQIFVFLLLIADYKTGKAITGRFWASELLGIKPRTFHKGQKRLQEKYDLVTLSSDNKKTTIFINNWEKYQNSSDTYDDNKVTTKGQQSDTNQELRNKNIYISNDDKIFSYFGNLKEDNEKIIAIAKKFDIRPKDVVWCINDMVSKCDEKGVEIKNVPAKLNTWINNSIRWHKVATLTHKGSSDKKKKADSEEVEFLKSIKFV